MENNFQEKGGGWEGKHAVNICLAFWESVNILYIECVPPPTGLPVNLPHAVLIEMTARLLVFAAFLVTAP
jgi:hypothetical protein